MFGIVKRTFDFVSAILMLILFSPLFLVITLLVRINLGAPVLFKQERTGRGMKRFYIYKFRTMTNASDEDGNHLPDEERQTKFGCFLRSTSLDELPELLNIILGQMSVIGPRPLPPAYDNFYTDREKMRFFVRGGLVTPDSVDRYTTLSWDKQLKYEADYAEDLSIKKGFQIFIGVIRIMFLRNKERYGSFVREPLSVERKKQKEATITVERSISEDVVAE